MGYVATHPRRCCSRRFIMPANSSGSRDLGNLASAFACRRYIAFKHRPKLWGYIPQQTSSGWRRIFSLSHFLSVMDSGLSKGHPVLWKGADNGIQVIGYCGVWKDNRMKRNPPIISRLIILTDSSSCLIPHDLKLHNFSYLRVTVNLGTDSFPTDSMIVLLLAGKFWFTDAL